MTPRQRLQRGLVRVPEGKRLFPRMTVRENLAMGGFLRSDKSAVKADIDAMCDRFPILRARQGVAQTGPGHYLNAWTAWRPVFPT